MYALTQALVVAHVLLALGGVLALALIGGQVARRWGQPAVVGEIVVALAVGPVLLAWWGRPLFTALWSPTIQSTLTWIGEVGLVLFLFGLSHRTDGVDRCGGRARLCWITAGGWLPAALAGAGLAAYIVAWGPTEWRGEAPALALILVLAAALSVTAVPVLARIITDSGRREGPVGRLSLSAAVLMDGAGWVLLTVGVAVAQGGLAGVARMATLVALLATGTAGLAWLLRRAETQSLVAARPALGAVVLATVVVSAALALGHAGLSPVIGAFVLGLAAPGTGPVAVAARRLGAWGAPIVPVFIVATGAILLAGHGTGVPWMLVGVVVALGMGTKVIGGYLGARRGGLSASAATEVGFLLNTRGLTEVVVLQMGVSAGILTADLFVAGVVLALISTVSAGPLLTAHARWSRHEAVSIGSERRPVSALGSP